MWSAKLDRYHKLKEERRCLEQIARNLGHIVPLFVQVNYDETEISEVARRLMQLYKELYGVGR